MVFTKAKAPVIVVLSAWFLVFSRESGRWPFPNIYLGMKKHELRSTKHELRSTKHEALMTMNPLQIRLAGLRRRLRLMATVRGMNWLVGLVLATAVGASWIDWVHPLPSLVRALILVAALSGAGYVTYRFLVRPLWARMDDLTLALRVETLDPSMTDSLASAVQFMEQPEGADQSGSPGLRRAAVKQALRQAQDVDFKKVAGNPGWNMIRLGAPVTAVFLALFKGHPGGTQTAMAPPGGSLRQARMAQANPAPHH